MNNGERLAADLVHQGWAKSIERVADSGQMQWLVVFSVHFQRRFKAAWGYSAGRESFYRSPGDFAVDIDRFVDIDSRP